MKRILFDEETNGFLEEVTKIHCIAGADVDTGARMVFGPNEIPRALEVLEQADVVIGHNAQRFDVPVLTKLYGFKLKPTQILRDTMILARLKHPNIRDTDAALVASKKMPALGHDGNTLMGSHKLEAWGYRLGCPKIVYDGTWDEWSQTMQDYCVGDIGTNLALWKYLRVDEMSQAAIELEHRIAHVCDVMERNGVPFDVETAQRLHAEWIGKKAKLEAELVAAFGSWEAPLTAKEGREGFIPKRDDKKRGYKKGVKVIRKKTVTFNPGSRDHITKVLMDRGWKPTEFTDGGKPAINAEVVTGIVGQYPDAAPLADYLTIDKRLSQLAEGEQAWLKAVKEDGCIHGVINPMGTTTSRASHFLPNLGQVPKLASPYGAECRGLFGKRKGRKLIGADMSGLELRGLAHYLWAYDGGKYAEVVLKGDPHWYHAQVMGLVSGERDKENEIHLIMREDGSKRFIYAYIYGCWDDKAGEIVFAALAKVLRKCGEEGKQLFLKFFDSPSPGPDALRKLGKKVRANFLTRIDGFQKLKDAIETKVTAHGRLKGLDGRMIPTRSSHSALNFLIQSAGAILCKQWICDAFDKLSEKYTYGLDADFAFVLWVHDELQLSVREDLAEEIGEIVSECARHAGEPFGFRVRLDSDYKIGNDWSETH